MYGLRRLNNTYSEHAGNRSDFIIVGHPEYNKGRVCGEALSPARLGRSEQHPKWDERRVPCHPKRSPAADRLRESGVADLWKRVHGATTATRACGGGSGGQEPRPLAPTLKERALERRARSPSRPSLGSGCGSAGDLRSSFGAFVRAMAQPLPAFEPPGEALGSGSSGALAARATRRHYEAMRAHLEGVQEQLLRGKDPEATRRELWETSAWKYYALQLETARRLEGRRRAAVARDRRSASTGLLAALP